LIGRSNCRVLALTVALASWALPVIAQTSTLRTLGSFPWDTSSADVLLQQVSSDKVVVQVRIVTESNTSAGRRQARPVPTEAMAAWVLLADGTALVQTPRQPPKGAPPVGVGNAGDRYAFVTFGFKSSANADVAAVVVKMEDQFHVLRVGRSPGSSPPKVKDERPNAQIEPTRR
jgi:hypothetical protein